MPPDVMVSTDIGNINSVANSYLRFDKPRSLFAAMSWGNCGYAFPPSSAPRWRPRIVRRFPMPAMAPGA